MCATKVEIGIGDCHLSGPCLGQNEFFETEEQDNQVRSHHEDIKECGMNWASLEDSFA